MADIDPGHVPTQGKESAAEFLKLGATSYGGRAIMGAVLRGRLFGRPVRI
jgi:hypothetical protein